MREQRWQWRGCGPTGRCFGVLWRHQTPAISYRDSQCYGLMCYVCSVYCIEQRSGWQGQRCWHRPCSSGGASLLCLATYYWQATAVLLLWNLPFKGLLLAQQTSVCRISDNEWGCCVITCFVCSMDYFGIRSSQITSSLTTGYGDRSSLQRHSLKPCSSGI